MKPFSKILVGVDLGWAHRTVAEELSEPNREAVRQAMWLAKQNSASIHFAFSLQLSAKAQHMMRDGHEKSSLIQQAEVELDKLVNEAREAGIVADRSVEIGKSWQTMIELVERDGYDLLVVGVRHKGAIEGMFLGGTALKLLRKCPCAVWVTTPSAKKEVRSILVAHDLEPAGEHALAMGAMISHLPETKLHVVHAYEGSEDHEKVEATISGQLKEAGITRPAQIHLCSESPDMAIVNCAEKHNADLIVVGTVGRSGVLGLLEGNTAERIYTKIHCSLLAVKPDNYNSLVEANEKAS